MEEKKPATYIAGLTVRSLLAMVMCMLLMGMWIQIAEVYLSDGNAMAEQPLAVPALIIAVALTLFISLLYAASRYRLLSKQEALCVIAAMLLSAPLMTQGMWHRFIGLLSATPRSGNFAYLDALSDKLWPHGNNLLEGALGEEQRAGITGKGNAMSWEETEYEAGHKAQVPVLRNTKAGETSSFILKLPLKPEGRRELIPGEPHLISFLAKAEDMAPESSFFCRIYADEAESFTEILNSKEKSKPTFLHKQGFLRMGTYGTKLPTEAEEYLRIEYGLSGPGTLSVYDPKLFSVAAMEYIFTGRRIVSASEYAQVPESDRAGLIVRPNNMWSPAGLAFLVTGYIPLRDWSQPAFAWSALVGLILVATLCMGVILRRQWAESERYPMPLFQIPYAILGHEEEAENRPFAAIWANPWIYIGIAVALAWGLMKGWHFYNTGVPNLDVKIALRPFFTSPSTGAMMDVTFTVFSLGLSLALFLELNVSISLVLGYFGYRWLFWLGEVANTKIYSGYPFRYEQTLGGYLAYAVLVVFFTRKYLWRVLKSACGRGDLSSKGEALSYRTALIILVLCFVGVTLWARWLQVPLGIILLYYAFLLLIGFVSAKFRTECGMPGGYFTPYNAMLVLTALGGMAVFGGPGMMVCLIASGFITVSVFFFIPGTQVELLEFGRRFKVVPRHLAYTALIAILGGLFIGGWVFLANAYALGGDNSRYQWAFDQNWFFGSYRAQLSAATSDYLRSVSGEALIKPVHPENWGYLIGAVPTVIATVLRQLFAGFWFHPIGAVLGSTYMVDGLWGCLLAAWVIRSLVLKLGGAATVRNRLLPFAAGLLLGAMISILVWNIYAMQLMAHGIDRTYGGVP